MAGQQRTHHQNLPNFTALFSRYMKMQLRCHLGAAIYRPENVQVLADVHCEGFVGQELVAVNGMNDTDPIKVFGADGAASAVGCQGIAAPAAGGYRGRTADLPGMAFKGAMRYKAADDASWTYISNGGQFLILIPLVAFSMGAIFPNPFLSTFSGHLGELACPEGMSRIRGHNVFSRTEMPVKMRSC